MHGFIRRRLRLVDIRDLRMFEDGYFDIIRADAFDVMVVSKNLGHIWCLHSPGVAKDGYCVLFHKWKLWHEFHLNP